MPNIENEIIVAHSSVETTACCGCLVGPVENMECNECGVRFTFARPADHPDPSKLYRRFEDMSPDGILGVFIQDDGDAIIALHAKREESDEHQVHISVEFCTLAGGGRSPRTLAAIKALARAIDLDNQESPSVDPDGADK